MKVKREGKALIVVDVQRDFCPGGALPVAKGDQVIRPLNSLIRLFDEEHLPVVFTRDWHPGNHCSFKESGGIWPHHCVRNTRGAKFHPDLDVPKRAIVISKATDPKREAYSGFQGTELAETLRERNVAEVFVGGLATDYCVRNTVMDALKSGFATFVLTDCIRGVNARPKDSTIALREIISAGAKATRSGVLQKKLNRRAALLSSS